MSTTTITHEVVIGAEFDLGLSNTQRITRIARAHALEVTVIPEEPEWFKEFMERRQYRFDEALETWDLGDLEGEEARTHYAREFLVQVMEDSRDYLEVVQCP